MTTTPTELDEALASGSVTAEVSVTGRTAPTQAVADSPPCTHDTNVLTNALVAFIKNDEGETTEWQMRVRAECGDCNTQFLIAPTGRVPRDGGLGVVVAMTPYVDQVPDLSAFAFEETP